MSRRHYRSSKDQRQQLQRLDADALAETCPTCGKRRYRSRKGGRDAIKRLGRAGMSVYRCGEFWHIGHRPQQVRQGWIERDAYKVMRDGGAQ